MFLDYVKDPRAAVIALVQGNLFSEARRIVRLCSIRLIYKLIIWQQIALHSRPELLEEIILPGTLESRAQIAEEIGEMKDQLRKQVLRLRELRIKKVEEPGTFCIMS